MTFIAENTLETLLAIIPPKEYAICRQKPFKNEKDHLMLTDQESGTSETLMGRPL
jgi:hypothetical protein